MNRSAKNSSRAKLSLAPRILHWARRALWLYALCAVLYLYWRFDLERLPESGVSPLQRFHPGVHLLVDRRDLDAHEGEALLFRDDLGRVLLGALERAPEGESRPGLWIVADNPDIALPDSRTLGPIAKERIVGRVVCALPGL